MVVSKSASISIIMLLFLIHIIGFSSSSTLTIVNNWGYTVWPVVASSIGTSPLSFVLQPGESTVIAVPPNWSGGIWGRTLCSQESSTGRFSCVTGDCASCTGDANPPVTIAELTLNGTGVDLYRVSLDSGYNLPLTVEPLGGRASYNCLVAGCKLDLNTVCPVKLKVVTIGGDVVGCESACKAFGDCNPNNLYSQFFKNACPDAHIDDADNDGSFSCPSSADYLITFNAAAAASTSLMHSKDGKSPTATNNSTGHQILLYIVKFFIGLIGTLIACYVVNKIRLYFSNAPNAPNAPVETSIELTVDGAGSGASNLAFTF